VGYADDDFRGTVAATTRGMRTAETVFRHKGLCLGTRVQYDSDTGAIANKLALQAAKGNLITNISMFVAHIALSRRLSTIFPCDSCHRHCCPECFDSEDGAQIQSNATVSFRKHKLGIFFDVNLESHETNVCNLVAVI
jgi:hypothetical protein